MRPIAEKDLHTIGDVIIISNHDGHKEYAIFEQVFTPQTIGEPMPEFVYYEQPSGLLQYKKAITKNGSEAWRPIEKYPFAQINGVQDYDSIDKLYDQIYEYVREHIDFTEEAFYHIVSAFIIASWRINDFDSVPYLMFLGEFMSGKTRALEVLSELCYHAIKTSSISPAGVVRLVDKYKVTLLVDETEILNTESKTELVGILNSGYKAGDNYIRAKQDSGDLEYWKTFGFKALAGTQDFTKTLNSRCAEIAMERATRPIRKKIDKEKASELRMQLLDYRLKNLSKPFEEVNLPFENGRNHELFEPLIQIAPSQHGKMIIDYGLKLEGSRRIEEETSFEGDVLRATLKVVKNNTSGRFTARNVYEAFKDETDMDADYLSKNEGSIKNRIGRVLKNKFHLEKGHHKDYSIDKAKLYRMMKRYTPDLADKAEEYLGNLDSFLHPEKSGQSGQSGLSSTNKSTDSTDSTDSTT